MVRSVPRSRARSRHRTARNARHTQRHHRCRRGGSGIRPPRPRLGLARTGATGSLFSGDLFLAFPTANDGPSHSGLPIGEPSGGGIYSTRQLPWNRIDPFYAVTVYGVEEAVLNALVVNETMPGRDSHTSPALPHDQLRNSLHADG